MGAAGKMPIPAVYVLDALLREHRQSGCCFLLTMAWHVALSRCDVGQDSFLLVNNNKGGTGFLECFHS